MEVHGVSWNSMEFHGVSDPWNSMEGPWNFVEIP